MKTLRISSSSENRKKKESGGATDDAEQVREAQVTDVAQKHEQTKAF